jgi:hypothetical protein
VVAVQPCCLARVRTAALEDRKIYCGNFIPVTMNAVIREKPKKNSSSIGTRKAQSTRCGTKCGISGTDATMMNTGKMNTQKKATFVGTALLTRS